MQTGTPYSWGPQEPHLDAKTIRRMRNLIRFGLFWAVAIVLRLIQLQVLSRDNYLETAKSQQERVLEVHAPRGTIYTRNGETLAMSTAMPSIVVNPMLVKSTEFTAGLLAGVLDIPANELQARIDDARKHRRGFLWVKRLVSSTELERVKNLRLVGVEWRDESARFYPKGATAAHVLGGVNHEEKGNGGVELALDEELEGIPGSVQMLLDPKDHSYSSTVETRPQPGKSLWLTIDERIQYVAEQALAKAAEGCKCKTGSVVVMDPRNGDVLAMASYPTYNPNETLKLEGDLSPRLNNAISAPFEPGSVWKVITLATGLEKTNLGPDTPINCLGGTITLHGRTIHEAKNGFGYIPMRTVLAKSSNVGAIQVALEVQRRAGNEAIYDYIQRFGFSKKTGIELPAEDPGVVHPPRKWSGTSIGSIAMGHEVTATTLQLAQAAAVIANNGRLVRPRIVLRKKREGEPLEIAPVVMGQQVINQRTAARMREMMGDVVRKGGTGTAAAVDGYEVGGKTGSAQIWDQKARNYSHKYNASFLGMVPLNKPQLVIVVTLNGSALYGGVVGAPVFHEIAAASLRLMDVRRDYDLPMLTDNELEKPKPLEVEAMNDAAVPPPVEVITADHLAYLNPAPNLMGKTLPVVLSETAAAGILVDTRGSGIVRRQNPAPGAPLQPGERILLEFAR